MSPRGLRGVRAFASITALLLAGHVCHSAAAQTVTATWQTPINGDWADPTRWSSNPNYPSNGTPAGTNYDAILGVSTTPYTVAFKANATVNDLTIGSGATLQFDYLQSRTLTVADSLSLLDGSKVDLRAGWIAGGTINGTGTGALVAPSGGGYTNKFTNTTINAELDLPDGADVIFSGSTSLGANGRVVFNGQQNTLELSTLLTGQGTIVFNGTIPGEGGNIRLPNTGVQSTIDAGITVTTGTANGAFTSGSLLNRGTMLALNGQALAMPVLDNQGTLRATNAGRLVLSDAWTNEGGITADGATIEATVPATQQPGTFYVHNGRFVVDGTTTVAAVDGLDVKGSVIAVGFDATVDNTGNTLNVVHGGNSWHLMGTITGGTIADPTGTPLEVEVIDNNFTTINASLANVQVTTDLRLDAGAVLTLRPGTTIAGRTIDMIGGTRRPNPLPTTLNYSFTSGVTLAAGTAIVFDGGSQSSLVTIPAVPAGVTVRTGTGGGTLANYGGTLTLAGDTAVTTPGHPVTLTGLAVVNDGAMTIASDAVVIPKVVSEATNKLVPVPFTTDGSLSLAVGGLLNVAGPFTQAAGGVAEFDLGGTGVGQFGTVAAAGDVQLTGELIVRLAPGYQPQFGDVFPIITTSAGAVSGAFTSQEFDTGGQQFLVSYNPTSVTLTAVPEPGSIAIFVPLAAMLLPCRRRRSDAMR
jgi:hypothetical protein